MENKNRTFRMLRADEIDCRVSTLNGKGLSLLLYKDARVDQTILDETFGVFGWKRSHQLIGDRLYCTVSVKDPETGEWISKQDVGTESYTEKEKGQASDSFKRACFNLGIGRELYTAPFIWIREGQFNRKKGTNGKDTTYDRFAVAEIGYTDGEISKLKIINTSMNNAVVYSYQEAPKTGTQQKDTETQRKNTETHTVPNNKDMEQPISAKQVLQLRMMCKRHEMPEEKIYTSFNKNSMEEMTLLDWAAFRRIGQEFLNRWDQEHQA